MEQGTIEHLADAKRDARRIPMDTAFTVSGEGDWRLYAGQTVVRRRNGGYHERDGVSMVLVDAVIHTTIVAEASDLAPLGVLEQPNLEFEEYPWTQSPY